MRREKLTARALHAIADAQDERALFTSAITAWELGTAEQKRGNRPGLGVPAAFWFRQALRSTGARLATITSGIAIEAAMVPATYGRGDPGDCFLIATARVRKLSLVSRDAAILRLARESPSYLSVIAC